MYCYRLLFLPALFCAGLLAAQPVIAFRNASLEGEPQANTAPHDWYYCNFPGESPPDLHPKGLYRVRLPAADGDTYVGMVCRDNGTFESIGQHLPTPLRAGQCYRWRGQVARSPRYQAIARSTLRADDFSAPIRLVFYGGSVACAAEYVLGWSDSITTEKWQTITVTLRVPARGEHLRIGVIPLDSTSVNGHVLLDAIEPLIPCDCNTGATLREPASLPQLEQPDWRRIATELDRHLRFPRTGISAFRQDQRTRQGLAILAQTVAYLERAEGQLDIGIVLQDRQAFRTVQAQFEHRLKELNLLTNRLRFKKLGRPPQGSWVGAEGVGILYLRPE